MWVVAGILLGLVVLGGVAGFHVGPHAHIGAGAVGVLAAVWLVVMAALGYATPLLYVLLAADVTVTGVMGLAGWKVLSTPETMADKDVPALAIEGKLGTAVGELNPDGVVRVGGEEWTALSLNGPIAAGTAVQVINVRGVRLEVWGEDNSALGSSEAEGEGALP